jgi:hypothetical protein
MIGKTRQQLPNIDCIPAEAGAEEADISSSSCLDADIITESSDASLIKLNIIFNCWIRRIMQIGFRTTDGHNCIDTLYVRLQFRTMRWPTALVNFVAGKFHVQKNGTADGCAKNFKFSLFLHRSYAYVASQSEPEAPRITPRVWSELWRYIDLWSDRRLVHDGNLHGDLIACLRVDDSASYTISAWSTLSGHL